MSRTHHEFKLLVSVKAKTTEEAEKKVKKLARAGYLTVVKMEKI